MSIKQPIYHEFDLNATSGNSRVISLTHTDDAHVDVIELCVKQNGSTVDITGATVIARMVLHSTTDILLNDSVPCTINDAGNILIPFDNAAVQTRKGIVKIEINITRDPDILTLQLPLWVKINGSILDSATVDPHSEGTIPELLEEVREELERVEGFATAEDVFEILDSALEGNPSVAPTLLIDNTVDQQFNPDGHWIMYYIDSDDLRHNIFDFANLPSGASDYIDLENKPQINNVTLSGNKSSDDLGLQKKLTAGTNITIANDGTISASGGVTSYNDLTNKPKFNLIEYGDNIIPIGRTDITIENVLKLGEVFSLRHFSSGDEIGLWNIDTNYLKDNLQFVVGQPSYLTYDFNAPITYNRAGIFRLWKGRCSHVPSFINEYFVIGISHYNFFVVHLQAPGDNSKIRAVVGKDKNGDLRFFIQQIQLDDNGTITSQTDWVELTGGGSQIVSGVVNQNGTITFTDSDGNTFTTTGSSVIGADGFSPTATVTQTASGATVSITDSTGTTTANISNGADGQDYVLTSQDKTDIANIVLQLLPTTQGVLYGNASN